MVIGEGRGYAEATPHIGGGPTSSSSFKIVKLALHGVTDGALSACATATGDLNWHAADIDCGRNRRTAALPLPLQALLVPRQ